MCIVCKDWLKGLLTKEEAWRNLNEIAILVENDEERSHVFEVGEMLSEEEDER